MKQDELHERKHNKAELKPLCLIATQADRQEFNTLPSAALCKLIKADQYTAIFICQFITVALLHRIKGALILNKLNGSAEEIIVKEIQPRKSPNY